MADLTPSSRLMYQTGNCDRTILLSVRGANAGDTVDVHNWLTVVKLAGLVSATGTTIAGLTPTTGPNGLTVLTIPAGPVNDGVWVIAVGVAGLGVDA
jgi:hypothetical protein